MKKGLLWNCQMVGHKPDPDFPVQQIGIENKTTEKFYVYGFTRCLACGCGYSLKVEGEKPSGLVTAGGTKILPQA